MPKPVRTDNQRHRTDLSEKRLAWTTINRREFIVMEEADEKYPDLKQVWIDLRGPKKLRFSLTAMTHAELQMFKQLMLEGITAAEPFCAELDRRAQEDYEKGNDVHSRLYRTPAELFHHGEANMPDVPPREGEVSEEA